MLIPKPRGDLSAAVFGALRDEPRSWKAVRETVPEGSEDAQIALWALYELHYGGFEDVDDTLEWHPDALSLRRRLEVDFERGLRTVAVSRGPTDAPFVEDLFSFISEHDGRSIAESVRREANKEQVLELLRHRSIYHLKESDPVAWVVPRLRTGPKAALMELQYDEYGCGDPNQLHAQLFAQGMRSCGLRDDYGAYIDDAPLEVLEQNNAMSLFGLHRRLRGAALGHLAAFEATSSLPSRAMTSGLARLGMPAEIIGYYEEHVAADAVHEQLAVRTICGAVIADEPALRDDVFFGAATCLYLEGRFATMTLDGWERKGGQDDE